MYLIHIWSILYNQPFQLNTSDINPEWIIILFIFLQGPPDSSVVLNSIGVSQKCAWLILVPDSF